MLEHIDLARCLIGGMMPSRRKARQAKRYAPMLGAITEFRKMEGISFDPEGKRLFLAMSEVSNGMEDAAKYQVPEIPTPGGFANQLRRDSPWQTEEVCHADCTAWGL